MKADEDFAFILRQTSGDRTEIPFLNLQSYEEFNKTKMGVLCELFDAFREKFEGLAEIKLNTISDYLSVKVKSSIKMLKEIRTVVSNYLSENKVKIVDFVGDRCSMLHCKQMSEILQSEYDVVARIGRRVDKTALNICLIHNAEYYERYGIDDPHNQVYNGVAVQHITVEDFEFSAVYAVRTVVQELLIKQDVLNKKVRLYDWKSLGYEDKISFLTSYSDENAVSHYICMEIAPDGTFAISEKQLNLFEYNDYLECIQIFENNSLEKSIRGVVKFPSGEVNIIRDSSIITIPELDSIKSRLQSGDTHLRNLETRNSLLAAVLDIKGYYKNGKMYYFAGVIGDGMPTKMECAVTVREIYPYNQSKLLFEQILPLMNVVFIRNGKLTIIPFPFKYLREYVKLQGKQMEY